MEKILKKCSMVAHKEIDAISFCHACKIYMCNKCDKLHEDLFKNVHQSENIKDKNMELIFTGFCKEKNHSAELLYIFLF